MKNIIEREILRYNQYYILLQYVINLLQSYMKTKHHYNLSYDRMRKMLIRWLLIKIIVRVDDDDPLFVKTKSEDLKTQIKVDLKTLFNINSIDVVNDLYEKYENMLNKINLTLQNEFRKIDEMGIVDNEVTLSTNNKIYDELDKLNEKDRNIITNNNRDIPRLLYKSDSLKKYINDESIIKLNNIIILEYYSDKSYLNTNNFNINYVFACYFRYKYIYILNQSLAYNYNDGYNAAIECFSTPFNRYSNHFFSAFPDLEKQLNSMGEFFNIMNNVINNNYTLPLKKLRVNPPFDEILDLRIAEIVISFLSKTKDVGYEISLILPDWSDFEAVDLLLNSIYHKKHNRYKKNETIFNNFFIGKEIYPCPIIFIELNNYNMV